MYSVMIALNANECKTEYINRGKLNRMCKYFRNKKVKIRFIYQDSLGHYGDRYVKTIYDAFEITDEHGQYGSFYTITFKLKGKEVYFIDFHGSAYFTGVGKIEYCNSGPYCYFSITL